MKRIRIVGLCLMATFALSAIAASSAFAAAPEYGVCEKLAVAGGAGYSDAGCTKAVASKAKYAWHNADTAEGGQGTTFSSAIKVKTKATLETVKKEKVVCTGESGPGKVLNAKEVETTPTFTGCETLKKQCATPGQPEGTIAVEPLQGHIGYETLTEPLSKHKLANSLASQKTPGGEIVEFECVGFVIKVKGTVLFPLTANKMLTTATVKFAASAGKQKPENFAGGPKETLESKFGGGLFEQSGQTITVIQTNSKAMEANGVA